MTDDDKKAFAAVVVGFAELKGKQLSPAAIELYWRAMKHWSKADFVEAAQVLIRTCRYMPEPYDFEQLKLAAGTSAGEAWAKALRFASGGQYRNGGKSGDPAIDYVVEMLGGWETIGRADMEKIHFIERRFAEHWEDLQTRERARDALPAIAGRTRLAHIGESLTKLLGTTHDRK